MFRGCARRFTPGTIASLLLMAGATVASAQEAPAPSAGDSPRAEAPPAAPAGTPSPSQLEPAVETTPRAPQPAASASGTSARTGSTAAPKGAAAAAASRRKGADRLELDTTNITGNRELPKVLYIVPWKRSDLGDLAGKPVNSLLDEVLQPLDRDVFQRQNRYYQALKPAEGAKSPDAVQGSGDKP